MGNQIKKTEELLDSNSEEKSKEIQLDLDKTSNDCHFGTIPGVNGRSFREVILILKEILGNGKNID